jgi:hypothetical protein
MNTMKAIIAALIIAASPRLACAESWILWKADTFGSFCIVGMPCDHEPRWRGPVKLFASEADCKTHGKAMVTARVAEREAFEADVRAAKIPSNVKLPPRLPQRRGQ